MSDPDKFARPRRIVDAGRCARIEAHWQAAPPPWARERGNLHPRGQ